MAEGWIKLHRQIMDTEDWLHEPFTRGQAWVDMLMLANHKDGSFRVRGIIVNIKRGQLGWSEENLAIRWKWSRGKVRRFFLELESETVHRIVQQKNNVSSIITILNYDLYQSNDTANDTANDTTDGHQTDTKRYTNKNVKNVKNGNKRESIDFIPPTPEQVKAYAEENGITNTDLKEWFLTRTENQWVKVNGQSVKNWQLDLRTADRRGYYPKKVVY